LEGWIDCSPFESLLGMTIEQAADGHALLTMPFNVMLANGGGVMHGGAMTTLADTAVAMAVKSLLPPGTVFATTRLTMEFLAPVLAGQVAAHARVHGPEGRLFQGKCELRGEQHELYARFESVFKVARHQS
jgi:acyl-CoA thioesterase